MQRNDPSASLSSLIKTTGPVNSLFPRKKYHAKAKKTTAPNMRQAQFIALWQVSTKATATVRKLLYLRWSRIGGGGKEEELVTLLVVAYTKRKCELNAVLAGLEGIPMQVGLTSQALCN